MTEEEAKTKWCPHAVASHTNPRAGFDDATKDSRPVFPCIASACMAWRWDAMAHGEALDDWWEAANIAGVQRGPEPELASFGYCGLAGKP